MKRVVEKFQPSENLSDEQVTNGLKLVVRDGLASEAMLAFTSGAFMVAIAVHLGASHFQIGFLASLPTLANVFQLVSVWVVQKFNNRRAICVLFSSFARIPLVLLGSIPFLFSIKTSIHVLILALCLHYFFAAISAASWNSWMKDLIPSGRMGTFFSHRARLMQIFNVCLSLFSALLLDYIRQNYPQYQLEAFSSMYILGGCIGLIGVYVLSRTPEPTSQLAGKNLLNMLKKPMRDSNFKKLLLFHCCWAFALNMATPFFSVFLMKSLHLPLSTVILLTVIGQLSSIFCVRMWGRFIDQYSNKTVIRICAPIYIICIFSWSFLGTNQLMIPMLIVIHLFSGMATGGINLSLINIGLKLAPAKDSIAYIATRNICIALFPAMAPIIGGLIADLFAQNQLSWKVGWKTATGHYFTLIHFTSWSFYFMCSSLLALFSLKLLRNVSEAGEVEKEHVLLQMRKSASRQYSPYRKRIHFIINRIVPLPAVLRYTERKK